MFKHEHFIAFPCFGAVGSPESRVYVHARKEYQRVIDFVSEHLTRNQALLLIELNGNRKGKLSNVIPVGPMSKLWKFQVPYSVGRV
jgi:hypothetical protein